MRELFYLLLAYTFAISGAIIATLNNHDFTTLVAFIALGWCCKLESEK